MRLLNLQLPAWLKTLFKATLWLTTIPLVFILVMAAINFWDEPLTEQSTAALTWQSPKIDSWKDNGFVTFWGLTAPVNQDAFVYGAGKLQEQINLFESKASGDTWQQFQLSHASDLLKSAPWACQLDKLGCLSQFVDQEPLFNQHLASIAPYLERYDRIFSSPKFDTIWPPSPYSHLPKYEVLTKLHALKRAIAIAAMKNGQTDQAIEVLFQNAKNARHLLRSTKNLVGQMMALRMIYGDARVLDEWLDVEPKILTRHERLDEIVSTIGSTQYSLSAAIQTEGRLTAFLLQNEVNDALARQVKQSQGVDWIQAQANRLIHLCFYQPNQTLNLYSYWFQSVALAVSLPAHELDDALSKARMKHREAKGTNAFGLFYPVNPIGKILINVGTSDYSKFAHRQHDVDGYLRLLQTKMWLMQERAIQPQLPVLELALRSPKSMHNPYNLRPMEWSAQNSELIFQGREVAGFNPTKTNQFKTKVMLN